MSDLFGQDVKTVKHPGAYAAFPGTGPNGKTCKTCIHRVKTGHRTKTYNKCDLVKETRGEGTDIKVSSPACRRYIERAA